MRLFCKLKLHKWNYHSEYIRACKSCGRHEERGIYLYVIGKSRQYSKWYEVNNHSELLTRALAKLGLKKALPWYKKAQFK
jgi:hypothetical protein